MPDSVLGKIALEIGGGAMGGGSPSSLSSGMGGGGNGADKGVKEQVGHLADIRKGSNKIAQVMGGQTRWWGKALKTMGIQVGVAGILKQSQIFTSTLGAMFQIFGAMVDVLLAPWLPVIIPMIRWMARGIPKLASASQTAFDVAQNKWWPTIQRWFSNITTKSWWNQLIFDNTIGRLPTWLGGNGNQKDPGEKAASDIKAFLPGWMGGGGGDGGGFPEIPFLSSIAEKLGSLGPIVGSIAAISGVLVAAKVVRYFTAIAKHIPVLGNIFKPFHILTRFIDEIAHLSIRLVMPRGMLSVWDDIVNTLYKIVGKAPPRVPAVPDAAKSKIWDRDEARDRGRLRQQRASDAARKARLGNRPIPGDKLYRNFDEMDNIKAMEAADDAKLARQAKVVRPPPATAATANIPKVTAPKIPKGSGDLKTFARLAELVRKNLANLMKNGKTLGAKGLSAMGDIIGPQLIKLAGVAQKVGGMTIVRHLGTVFRVLIGPVAAGLIAADTAYGLKQLWDNEQMGWTKDWGKWESWEKDIAKFGMVSAAGDQQATWIAGLVDKGKSSNIQQDMYKDVMGQDMGAILGSKAFQMMQLGLTGAVGTVGTAVPGPWSIAAVMAAEAGQYSAQSAARGEGGEYERLMDLMIRQIFGGDQFVANPQLGPQPSAGFYPQPRFNITINGFGTGNGYLNQE